MSTPTAQQFLDVLRGELGYKEGWNGTYWNNDTKYGRWYGMNYAAWCAMFQSWGAYKIGALGTLVPKYASCTAGLNWFRERKQTGVWPPQPGDIFILLEYAPTRWNAQANGWAPIHTGAVERWVSYDSFNNKGHIVTLEGNTNTGGSAQGNGVYRLQRFDSREGNHLIYCRPKWGAEPTAPSRDDTRPALGFNYAPIKMDMSIQLDVSQLRPKKVDNKHVARLQSAMWNWRGAAFRRSLVSKYKLTSRKPLYSGDFDEMTVWMVGDCYRLLHKMEPKAGWLTDRQFQGKDPLPTWPGPAFLRRIGFKTLYNT